MKLKEKGYWKTEEWLTSKYWTLGRSAQEIGDEVGVSHNTVLRWMKKFEIPLRGPSHSTPEQVKNREWLTAQYWTLGKSAKQIAQEEGIDAKTVAVWLKKLCIRRRTKSEAVKVTLDTYYEVPGNRERVNRKISKTLKGKFVGDESFNWKGGKTELSRAIRNSIEYKDWRRYVLARDNYTCNLCGERGGKLCIDHIKPLRAVIRDSKITTMQEARACADVWNTCNGRALCEPCHKKTDTYGWRALSG